jgi:hypothetical protein
MRKLLKNSYMVSSTYAAPIKWANFTFSKVIVHEKGVGKNKEILMVHNTDYRRPMKPFCIEIQNFWAWADKFWGICGINAQTISTHFDTVSPLSMFPIIQVLFLQIKTCYTVRTR